MNLTLEIYKKMDTSELLTGLAEEAAELAQAALKLRRALYKLNPTPMSEDEAYERLCEEAADVLLYLDVIRPNKKHVSDILERKKRRWAKRLGVIDDAE